MGTTCNYNRTANGRQAGLQRQMTHVGMHRQIESAAVEKAMALQRKCRRKSSARRIRWRDSDE